MRILLVDGDPQPILTRIFHRVSTAGAQSSASTALRLFGRLDILSYMPSSPSLRAPYTPDRRNTKIALRGFLAQGKEAGSA